MPFRDPRRIVQGSGPAGRARQFGQCWRRWLGVSYSIRDACFRTRLGLTLVRGGQLFRFHDSHQELAYQLVRTGLAAEMLRSRRPKVERVPSTDAQTSGIIASDEPMVGLALVRSADIAGYDLLDHCRSFL